MDEIIKYEIKDQVELNLSYMPFIKGGGLFVPTGQNFALHDTVMVDLQLTATKENIQITGKVIWITPPNALHHVLPGIGLQFTGPNAQSICSKIESYLDKSLDVGSFTYGVTDDGKKGK